MANRVPLVIDASTLYLKELPANDNLDLTGSGIHNAGVITATSFSGDGSGLTGVAAGYLEKTSVGVNTVTNVGVGTTNPYTLFLVLGGVLQEPIISFTINQDQITFAAAPTTGANCYIVVLGNTFHTGGLRTLPIVLKNGTTVKNIPLSTTTIPVVQRGGSYVPVMVNAG